MQLRVSRRDAQALFASARTRRMLARLLRMIIEVIYHLPLPVQRFLNGYILFWPTVLLNRAVCWAAPGFRRLHDEVRPCARQRGETERSRAL